MKVVHQRHVDKAISIIENVFNIRVVCHTGESYLNSSSNPWIINKQWIVLGTNSKAQSVLIALAHELGHCLSVRKGSPSSMSLGFIDRLGAPLTRKQKKLLLKEERAAWTLGYRFLRSNNLPITDWMKYARRVLITSHVKRLGL